MDVRQGASFVALALNICEHLYHLPEEVEYVWSAPWRFYLSSFLFMVSRYSPYLIYLFNAKYAQTIIDADPTYGQIWLVFKILSTQSMIFIVELILLKRLYHLYNRRRIMKLVVVLILSGRVLIVAAMLTLAYKMAAPNVRRDGLISIFALQLYGTGELVLQSIILIFMLVKHFSVTLTSTGRTPLSYRLTREGVEVPILSLATIAASMLTNRYSRGAAQAVYPFYLAIMSVMGCRLILSTHKYLSERRSQAGPGLAQAFVPETMPLV